MLLYLAIYYAIGLALAVPFVWAYVKDSRQRYLTVQDVTAIVVGPLGWPPLLFLLVLNQLTTSKRKIIRW